MPQTPSTSHLGLALDGQPLDGAGCSGRLDPGSAGGDGVAQRLAVLKQRGGGLAGAASDVLDACYPSGSLAYAADPESLSCAVCRAGWRSSAA